jgi:hypothetical protein
MKPIRISLLVISAVFLSLLAVAFAQQPKSGLTQQHGLVLEIALVKSFDIPASVTGQGRAAFVRVNAAANSQATPMSAIKLMPEMIGDKMKVTISVVSGDTSGIKTCSDWYTLKQTTIASYTISEGDEVTVPELTNLGANFKDGKLTFRAVSYKALPQPLNNGGGGGGCGCGWCGGLSCCPNPGFCINCSPCGDVCCAPQP